MPDATPGGNPVSSNRNVMIVLSYLFPLTFIPFITEKNDPEVHWHSKHGLVLFAAEMIVMMVATGVSAVLPFFGGCLFMTFSPVVFLGIAALHIFAIVKGINGERLIIPGISEFADRF